jgi:hypothetical protein
MQPTPDAPPPAPPAEPPAVSGLVDLFTNDRQRGGMLLLGACTVFLLLALFCAWQASRAPADAEPPKEDPLKLAEPEKPKNPHRGAYILAAVTAGAACLQLASVAAWLIVSLAPPEIEKRRTQARAAVLAAGSGLGTIFMVAGLLFFYRWSGSLSDWLDRGQTKEAKFVLIPFLAILLGAALTFVSLFPARAEERNNPQLRRWVYGMNLKLVVLLAFLALLLVNLIVGPRLPNRLDTTDKGFYSLSPNTIGLLQKLPEPITAHVILQGGRVSEDVRRLAANCADASSGKFVAKVVNPTADLTEYQRLVGKYPVLEANEYGVLLTVGADGKRHSFLRADEFSQRDQRNPEAGTAFVGEARLLKELLFLAENEKKAVVYFTQSSGELPLAAPLGEAVRQGSVAQLGEFLGRNNLEVRPLRFDAKDPKVPDDAAVVLVAEPRQPLPPDQVMALRRYMTDVRPGGQKGKLIVLAGATFGAAPKREVLPTGLEPLLAEYGVRLDQRFVLCEPGRARDLPPQVAIAEFTQSAVNARNPIALALGKSASYPGLMWREVSAAPQGAPGGARPTTLLITEPGRVSWLEDRLPTNADYNRTLEELNQSQQARIAKAYGDAPRSVGVAVADGDAGRLVVIGNSNMVIDAAAGDPSGFDLVGASVDWLRDRPALSFDVQSKKYQEFRFPATADENRGLWLPLVIGVVAVLGLGSAVWVVRRRTA